MTTQKLVITNIGQILSGKIEAPFTDWDCIIAVDGKITGIGKAKDLDIDQATVHVNAHGVTVTPGLIDSHVHPVIGDYTPRQQQLNWIDSCLHGGVTTMISAGEVHAPGRPKDIVGLKAMAIASQRWYENFRPSGVKMLAGAPVIEDGMVESDFKDLADAGVKLLGEVGLGSVNSCIHPVTILHQLCKQAQLTRGPSRFCPHPRFRQACFCCHGSNKIFDNAINGIG